MHIQWRSCFKIGVSLFLLYLCIQFWPSVLTLFQTILGAASPLIIGCAIAYLVNILMAFYERHFFKNTAKPMISKIKRPVCMLSAFITLFAIIILVVALVLPQLISCVNMIFSALPGAITKLVGYLSKLEFLPEDIINFLTGIDWQSKINGILSAVTSGLGSVVGTVVNVVSSVFSGIVTAFLAIIFSIYLLLGKDKLRGQFHRIMERYLKETVRDRIMYVITILDDCFHRYIVGQCTEAVILGVLCALGMWIIGLPYATMIGALIAFTALIPVAGAYIGGGIGALMIFSVSPIQALIFLIYLVVLQQLEGNLIYPKVVGSSLGLPAIWVLAAVTVGGGIMGILGMLLGVPIVAALYRILKNDVNKSNPVKETTPAEPSEPEQA